MACPHIETTSLQPPRADTVVYKDECTQCFDSYDTETGIDVCLSCFNGGCIGETTRNHAVTHYQKKQHPLVVNIRRTRKRSETDERPQKMTKLEIKAESDADLYDIHAAVKCYECGGIEVDATSPKVASVVDAIVAALDSAAQNTVQAWKEEITPCSHTSSLQPIPTTVQSQGATCAACELNENLWLCLTCGRLGCGRSQYGSDVKGNSHGVAHYKESGHPVAVKLGTITPESADVYCYQCDDMKTVPDLAKHLAAFGIQLDTVQKTEKSIAEMNLEQNLRFDFSLTSEQGKTSTPLFGPGLTGLKNVGNTCYMASCLQVLMALPESSKAFLPLAEEHQQNCSQPPAACFACQMGKMAEGLISGRYAVPSKRATLLQEQQQEKDKEAVFQDGVPPTMFKSLIGKGHPEFATVRQQDAVEFLQHLMKQIETFEKKEKTSSLISSLFDFTQEERIQCTGCAGVRYRPTTTSMLSLVIPAEKGDGEVKYKDTTLEACLAAATAPETLEAKCAICDATSVKKQSGFKTYPKYALLQLSRFIHENWVPAKMSAKVVPPARLNLSEYKAVARQDGENVLEEAVPGPQKVTFDEAALQQLGAMGFDENRCKKALLKTGHQGAEVAMQWLFENLEAPDLDLPLDEAELIVQPTSTAIPDDLISSLQDMGFTALQAKKALKETDLNMERAVDWLFSHPDETGEDMSAPTATAAGSAAPVGFETPGEYALKAVICHKGTSVFCGHYVAYIHTPSHGWVLFNDEKVVQSDAPELGEGYLYVYARVNE